MTRLGGGVSTSPFRVGPLYLPVIVASLVTLLGN